MKAKPALLKLAGALLLSTLIYQPSTSVAQGTIFTYQGRLNDNGQPANETNYGMLFYLYDAPTGGSLLGNLGMVSVSVSNGLFTVPLNFDNVFDGNPRWLEISVQKSGGGFTTLTPRQQLTPAPYAITAGRVVSGGLSSGAYTNAVTFNNTANSFTGNGGGLTNVSAATLGGLGATQFWKLGGNSVVGGQFLGSTNNQPVELRAKGERILRLEPDSRFAAYAGNLVAGYTNNSIEQPGTGGSAILGGGYFAGVNIIRSNSSGSFIGAGSRNTIGPAAGDAFIGAGFGNSIREFTGVIGGGEQNTIQPLANHAFIGGGRSNVVSGVRATVPGGSQNIAAGSESFAAGQQAQAIHAGTFVWADSQGGPFASTAINQFSIRAGGGVRIAGSLDVAGPDAAQLRLQNSATGNSWYIYDESFNGGDNLIFQPNTGVGGYIRRSDGNYIVNSDARLKRDIATLNGVLERVLQLRPVSYQFRSEPENGRTTFGFIAQEVEPLFPEVVAERAGLKGMAYSELVPVAVGAIQELNQKLTDELKKRDAENAVLKQRLDSLEKIINGQK